MLIKILPATVVIWPLRSSQTNMWIEKAFSYVHDTRVRICDTPTLFPFSRFIALLVMPNWYQSLIYILQVIETVRAPVV
jgi:hypothetical protein